MSWSLAIHGGAGDVRLADLSQARRTQASAGLRAALESGGEVLAGGGAALDAVETAVRVLEDDPQFNAGRGAVLTSAGTIELDAGIMDGHDQRAGSLAAVRELRHPISGARRLLEAGEHVLLVGQAARAFALAAGGEAVGEDWLITDRSREQWQRQRERGGTALDHGTVGAVARDEHGRLAAATSTGGMTNQAPGRVGDTPIIGGGTWADRSVAVSATGTGEVFIRCAFAHQVAALMELRRCSLATALRRALRRVAELGGSGGAIAIDAEGRIELPYISAGMYRGAWRAGEPMTVGIGRPMWGPAEA